MQVFWLNFKYFNKVLRPNLLRFWRDGRTDAVIEEYLRTSFCIILKWTVDCCLSRCMLSGLDDCWWQKSVLNSATTFTTNRFSQWSRNAWNNKEFICEWCSAGVLYSLLYCPCLWNREVSLNCINKFSYYLLHELRQQSCSRCCCRLLNRTYSSVFLVALRQI